MQTGEYISNRATVAIIRDICNKKNISFNSLSDEWLLELSKDGKLRRILGYKFTLNDSVSSSIAGDKVATYILLDRAGLPSVPHTLLRPKVTDEQKKPLMEWKKIVVKPLDGSGGHGVRLFANKNEAIRWIESTSHPAWAAAPFIDIKREVRIVLLDAEPLIVYEKQPVTIDGLKMFNLGLGATPIDLLPDPSLITLAAQAQLALGLRLCAVDVVETATGERMVLELNSGFMMEHYIQFSDKNKQRAVDAYNKIIKAVMEG